MWNPNEFFKEIKKITRQAEQIKLEKQKKSRKLVKKSEIFIDGRILGPAFWLWNQASCD